MYIYHLFKYVPCDDYVSGFIIQIFWERHCEMEIHGVEWYTPIVSNGNLFIWLGHMSDLIYS